MLMAMQLLFFTGCQSSERLHSSAISEFDRGNSVAALSLLDEAEGKLRAEKELIATDRAVAALLDGQPASCEAILRETRR